MTNVELTPAELEMIKLKREQEQLAKKEAELRKQTQLEKDIAEKKAYITKVTAKDAAQVQAAQDFAKALGAGFKVEIRKWADPLVISGDYLNPENPTQCNYQREKLWEVSFDRQSACIVHGAYKVSVDEQVVYSNRWSARGTSKGIKMYVSGPGIDWKEERRALSRPQKAKEKIETAIAKIKAEEEFKNKQKSALQKTVERFKAEYPDAEVTADRGYERGYGRRYSEGITYDMVRVKFANGCSIAYRVYPDGSLSRVSFNLPGAKDEATFMQTLSQMKF